jgi:hypothetical protein
MLHVACRATRHACIRTRTASRAACLCDMSRVVVRAACSAPRRDKMQDATPAQHARCGVQSPAPLGVRRQASPPPQRRAADRTAEHRHTSAEAHAQYRNRPTRIRDAGCHRGSILVHGPHERSGALHSHLALSHVALSHLVLPREVEQCLVHNSITTPQRKHLRARTNKQTSTRARGKARLSQRETELRRIEAWTGGGPSRAVLAGRYASDREERAAREAPKRSRRLPFGGARRHVQSAAEFAAVVAQRRDL